MITGSIFDIKEFAVHDGPGIRTTVFLKGCPLRCAWCHNPEGWSSEPQVISSSAGDRTVGQAVRADDLAELLNGQAPILKANEGGVTFSGGEPLMQGRFVVEVINRLEGVHVLLDTSGYADGREFCLVVEHCDLVHFDLKVMDPVLHQRLTGQDNAPILGNLHRLADLGVPYVIRVPLVPGITDTDANLAAIAEALQDLPGLIRVDLLTYNRAAGGKYRGMGMTFKPTWDETETVNANTAHFTDAGLKVSVHGLRMTEGH